MSRCSASGYRLCSALAAMVSEQTVKRMTLTRQARLEEVRTHYRRNPDKAICEDEQSRSPHESGTYSKTAMPGKLGPAADSSVCSG